MCVCVCEFVCISSVFVCERVCCVSVCVYYCYEPFLLFSSLCFYKGSGVRLVVSCVNGESESFGCPEDKPVGSGEG